MNSLAQGFFGRGLNEDHSDDEIVHDEEYIDILKGGRKSLNLDVADYCDTWKARHGWRELYQNWFGTSSRSRFRLTDVISC